MIPAGEAWCWRNSRWRADARLPAESFLLSLFTHRAAHISFHISSDTKSSLPHSAWKAPHTSAHLHMTAGSSLMKCIIIAQQSSSRAIAGPAPKAAMGVCFQKKRNGLRGSGCGRINTVGGHQGKDKKDAGRGPTTRCCSAGVCYASASRSRLPPAYTHWLLAPPTAWPPHSPST